jgi:hypothetical protein
MLTNLYQICESESKIDNSALLQLLMVRNPNVKIDSQCDIMLALKEFYDIINARPKIYSRDEYVEIVIQSILIKYKEWCEYANQYNTCGIYDLYAFDYISCEDYIVYDSIRALEDILESLLKNGNDVDRRTVVEDLENLQRKYDEQEAKGPYILPKYIKMSKVRHRSKKITSGIKEWTVNITISEHFLNYIRPTLLSVSVSEEYDAKNLIRDLFIV